MHIRPTVRRGARRRFEITPLEPRQLLSVDVGVLANVETAPGNVWQYDQINADGTVDSTETDTVVSATTYGGQPAVEFDRQYDYPSSGQGTDTDKEYFGLSGQQLVEYAETDNHYDTNGIATFTTSRTFEPYQLLFATLSVGSPVTSTFTQNFTVNSDGSITQGGNTQTVTGELVSDTMESITVPAGTFSCYHVTEHIDITNNGGNNNGTPNTRDFDAFVAPGVGFVETSLSVDGGSPGDTTELTSFTGGDRLVFDQPPTTVQGGDPIKPAIAVSVRDSAGKVDTGATGTVTLTPAGVNGANPITGNTATLVNGIATFSDVELTKAGVYQLQATDTNDDAMVTSEKFGVGGDTLQFSAQPKNGDVNEPLTFKVRAVTSKGKLDTKLDDSVQVGLNVVSGGTNAALSGTTTVAMVGGVATFKAAQGVAINVAGSYTLSATALSDGSADATVTGATSDGFSIAGDHLVFSSPPGKTNVFDPVTLKVSLENAKGKVDKSENSAQVELSLNTESGGEGAELQGTTTVTFVAGVAVFPKSAAPTVNGGGTFTLTATEVGADDPATAQDSKPFVIQPLELRPFAFSGINNRLFLAVRSYQVIAFSAQPIAYLGVYTAQGKQLTETDVAPSRLPDLLYTVIPVSSGASVDHSQDTITGGVNELAPHETGLPNPLSYDTHGNFLPFATPGSYRLEFDPGVPSGAGATNDSAAPSAIKPYTSPLLKVVDPVIVPTASARVVAAGGSFSVSAVLGIPDEGNAADHPVTTEISVGIRYQLVGPNGTETYAEPLGTPLELAPHSAGTYHVVVSVIYTPSAFGSTPFTSSNYLVADGLASLTIPIVVTG